MYSLSNLEAADCCKAFLSSLYSPLVYRDLLELKQHYLGYMASEKTLLEWIINSIMTYNPAVTNLMDKGCSEVVNVKSEYEDDMSSSQTHCDVDVPNAPECCDALLHMLYGKDLCDKWRQLMHLMGYNSYSKFMQWCLENVQKQRVSYDGEEEDITQKYYTSCESEQATSQVSYEEVETALLSKCVICLRFFQSEIRLEQHILAVHLKVSFITQKEAAPNCCDLCTLYSSDVMGLAKHYVEVHPYYKPYLCDYCGQTFKHKEHIKVHCSKQHGISDFSQVTTLEVWPKYLCCYCYQRFESECSLKKHIYYTHSKAQIPHIEDKICESYDGASGGVGVFQASKTSTTHYCDLCGFQTGKEKKLVKHYFKAHPYYKPYLCAHCGHTFKNIGHRKAHLLKGHGISDVSETSSITLWPKNKCGYCYEQFETERSVKRHIYDIHSKARIPKNMDVTHIYNGGNMTEFSKYNTLESYFGEGQCDLCVFRNDDDVRLAKHYLQAHSHYKPYLCEYCGHAFKHKKHRIIHCFKQHGISDLSQPVTLKVWPKYLCCYCYQKFESERSLKRHISDTHSSPKLLFVEDEVSDCPDSDGSVAGTHVNVKLPTTNDGHNHCDMCLFETDKDSRLTKHYVEAHPYYKPYMCDYCGHTFKHRGHRRDHWLKVHGISDLSQASELKIWPNNQCCYCRERFESETLAKIHIYNMHSKAHMPTKETLSCVVCGYVANCRSRMEGHMIYHSDARPFTCPLCDRGYKTKSNLNDHIGKVHKQKDVDLTYLYATAKQNETYNSYEHMINETEGVGDALGSKSTDEAIRDYIAASSRKLQDNVLGQVAQTQYMCPHCEEIFSNKETVVSHIKDQHAHIVTHAAQMMPISAEQPAIEFQEPLVCSTCCKVFKRHSNLVVHEIRCHGKKSSENVSSLIRPPKKKLYVQKNLPKPYECPECKDVKKCFTTRSRLELHIRKTHTDDADITKPSDIPLTFRMFTCKYCNVPKKGYYNLIDHVERIHEKIADKYICESCGFQTNAIRSFRRHELAKHKIVKDDSGNVTGYYCLKCEEGFAEQVLLRDHIHKEHYRPLKTMCDICGKCFLNQSTMKRHRACHSDARTALCPYCSRLFKDNQSLKRHVKHIHDKQKNFNCDQCDLKCSTASNLRSHKVFAHQKQSDFQCEECGKYLPNKNHLQQHINKHRPPGKTPNEKTKQLTQRLSDSLWLNAGTVIKSAQGSSTNIPDYFLGTWDMQ